MFHRALVLNSFTSGTWGSRTGGGGGGGEKLAGGHGLTAVATDWLMRDTDRLMGATDWLMGASEWLMGVTDWMMGVTDWLMWDGLADGRHGLADEGRTS